MRHGQVEESRDSNPVRESDTTRDSNKPRDFDQGRDSRIHRLPAPTQGQELNVTPNRLPPESKVLENIEPAEPANDFSMRRQRPLPQVIQASGTEPIRPVYQLNLSDSSLGK